MSGAESGASAPVELEVVDRSSFDDFYRQEYRPLLRLAWSLTGRRDVGEELVQETMLTVHRKWSTVVGYERPGAFARRVLLNDATSHARRRSAEQRAVERSRSRATHTDELPPDESFWAALRSLPHRQRSSVALHYLEDLSVADVADVLEIAEGTVKVHLHRGRCALAEALRDELEPGGDR